MLHKTINEVGENDNELLLADSISEHDFVEQGFSKGPLAPPRGLWSGSPGTTSKTIHYVALQRFSLVLQKSSISILSIC